MESENLKIKDTNMNPLSINNSMVDKPVRYKIEKCWRCDGDMEISAELSNNLEDERTVPCPCCTDGTQEVAE